MKTDPGNQSFGRHGRLVVNETTKFNPTAHVGRKENNPFHEMKLASYRYGRPKCRRVIELEDWLSVLNQSGMRASDPSKATDAYKL
jgi:hypothetical protein